MEAKTQHLLCSGKGNHAIWAITFLSPEINVLEATPVGVFALIVVPYLRWKLLSPIGCTPSHTHSFCRELKYELQGGVAMMKTNFKRKSINILTVFAY
jgi:hypothetical protein